ncbi:hypothetical protein NE865_08478 [Phthorimaea operculella]|nr:hypothetical protein NE865_08478 [Phthorimaea operculella]
MVTTTTHRLPTVDSRWILLATMKLLWCCLAALIAIASGAVDVERTVKQVQTILQSNSALPRLSREEIIQLLNDIKAEDAKSKSSSTEHSRESKEVTPTTPFNTNDNEVNPIENFEDNIAVDEKKYPVFVTAPSTTEPPVETTKKAEPTVMVVLPYTPRDGSSLQELYTKPPRTEVLPESKVTPKPFKDSQAANPKKQDFPSELQSFLDAHGLKGKPGQDSFLLPLDGFKPLPPATVVDGSVQLPENILLTYDLLSPSENKQNSDNVGSQSVSSNTVVYEPIRPEILLHELETSSSEIEKSVLPLDLPKSRKTKSASEKPKFEPVDYDSIKVIPLNQGPAPFEEEKAVLESEQNKRQASTTEATTASEAITNPPADKSVDSTDAGASITDLEDSFGGAAPEQPGDSVLPPPKKNGFYWMLDWNSFLEVGDEDNPRRVNIRFEPKLGDPQMFIPVTVP